MHDHRSTTLHIPADIESPIEVTTELDITDTAPPVYVAHGGDRESISFYSDNTNMADDNNIRANLMADAISCEHEPHPVNMVGDIYLVCPDHMAKDILENDQNYQDETRAVRAFQTWVADYSVANGVYETDTVGHVGEYIENLHSRANKAAMINKIADLFGIDSSQIGIIRLTDFPE